MTVFFLVQTTMFVIVAVAQIDYSHQSTTINLSSIKLVTGLCHWSMSLAPSAFKNTLCHTLACFNASKCAIKLVHFSTVQGLGKKSNF